MNQNEYVIPTIKLTFGKGDRGKAACWMSALSAYVGSGEWTDRLDCVDPTINTLCIAINDLFGTSDIGNKNRNDTILPRLFDPIGTKGSKEDQDKRYYYMWDVICRDWIPNLGGFYMWQSPSSLDSLTTIVDEETLSKAWELVGGYFWEEDKGGKPKDIIPSSDTLGTVIYNVAARSISLLSIFLFGVDENKANNFIHKYMLPVLDHLIQMGPHAPQEPACSPKEFHEAVGGSSNA